MYVIKHTQIWFHNKIMSLFCNFQGSLLPSRSFLNSPKYIPHFCFVLQHNSTTQAYFQLYTQRSLPGGAMGTQYGAWDKY